MKVIHLLDNFYDPDPRVQKEMNSLINNLDIQIILICMFEKQPEVVDTPRLQIQRIIPNAAEFYYKFNTKSLIQSIIKTIDENDIAIVHAHDHISLHFASLVKKYRPTIRIIYDAHEYIRGWYYYENESNWYLRQKGKIVHGIYGFFEKRNLKNVDYLITVSEGIADLYRKLKVKSPISVLRNVSDKNLNKASENVREKLGLADDDIIVLHSGAIYYSQEIIDLLLDNLLNSDDKIKIVFLSKEMDRVKVFNSKFYSKLKQRIYFHDFVSYEDLSSFISTADIGLMLNYKPDWPSHWHSLPNRIFDYSNAGLAILSTNQPEFKRFVVANNNGVFFDINEKHDLSRQLKLLVNSIDIYKVNSLKGIEFNCWGNEEKELIKVYSELTDSPN